MKPQKKTVTIGVIGRGRRASACYLNEICDAPSIDLAFPEENE